MDGEVYEFGKGSGGGVPTLGVDFTYTGECEVIDDSTDSEVNWKIKFLTSGTFIPLNNMIIDAFYVGGGGGGGGIAGAGGGYTKTEKFIYLEQNTEYPIVIGSGGTGVNWSRGAGNNGGNSSGFNYYVLGGYGGAVNTKSGSKASGGDGGSGGGGCGHESTNSGNGGSDGSDGEGGRRNNVGVNPGYNNTYGGNGQGSTTREFGEITGDLYSGGGGGGVNYFNGDSGSPDNGLGGSGGGADGCNRHTGIIYNCDANTGGGGGGGQYSYRVGGNTVIAGSNGGSGILIIRNHRE